MLLLLIYYLDCVVLCNYVSNMEGDVGGRLHNLHLDLHVPRDAKVAIDKWLKLYHIVERLQGSG